MACRVNRQRIWTFRLELEARAHASSVVVTLTYENAPPQLVPRDAVLWLKRLRKRAGSFSIRYFLVGEYGEATSRPHFHAILFGVNLDPRHDPLQGAFCRCCTCVAIRETWGHGRILVDQFSAAAARYVCGYVTKKLTRKDDPRLLGRHPEFTRMSRRPGIGAFAVPRIHECVVDLQRSAGLRNLLDVPTALRAGGQMRPLGRYLVGKLREADGRDPRTPPAVKEEKAREMHALCEARGTAQAFGQVASETAQKAAQTVKKHRLYTKGGTL